MIHDLFAAGIPLGEKAIRSVAVYLFLVAVLRLAGKREIAQLNNFDFVVLLLLSNTVQNAIIGDDNSLWGGLLGAAALLAGDPHEPADPRPVDGDERVGRDQLALLVQAEELADVVAGEAEGS